MVGVHEIGSQQTPSEVSGEVQIETSTCHEPDCVIVPEDFGPQAMLAHESFEKRGKIMVTKSYLRPSRDIEELYLVNSGSPPGVPAAPLTTAVQGQTQPAGKIVGHAGADSARIPF